MHNGILMKTGSLMGVQHYIMPAISLASRSMSVQRITRELREDEELRGLRKEYEALQLQMHLHNRLPYLQQSQRLREGRAYSSDRKARQPNLAYFAVASVTAGLATMLYMEGQDAGVQKAGSGPRVPDMFYRKEAVATRPHPLRVRLETNMAQQDSLQAELLSSQLSGKRKREIGKDLKRLEVEQTELQQEARRELLHSDSTTKRRVLGP